MLSGLALSSTTVGLKRYDFRFSQGGFRQDEIFDSALSVPGRYVLEVGRRVLADFSAADWVAVGNPLLPLSAQQLRDYLAASGLTGVGIATDASGFPVLYLLPRPVFDDLGRFLLMLSATDAALDAQLLGVLLGLEVATAPCGLPALGKLRPLGLNGWLNGDGRQLAGQLSCKQAIQNIQSRPDWRDLPFAVYYPMHAGDVLFFCVASQRAEGNMFSKQVVCTSYADIPGASGSKLESIPLRLPWISRDGSVSELEYYNHALKRLGPEVTGSHFIVFARILRLYFHTPFHLLDHAAFALGDSMESFEKTVHAKASAAPARCSLPISKPRALFHLNGGWTLKNLPPDTFRQTARALINLGWEVSVIDRPDLEDCGARSVEAGDSASLRAQVEAHHIFIGVDSFPHHFVRLVMGWPVVGLFGNTKPCNSDGTYDTSYRASCRDLSCNRCGAWDVCPMFGRKDCLNYAEPQRIVADVLDLARGVYGIEM